VTNAIKYMGDAPVRRVRVDVHEGARSVRIEVSDTGPGVPFALRSHLFDPYVRGADSNVPGLGLGLATVRRLAEAHGGGTGMEPARGGGSVFWFELPKESSEPSERSDPNKGPLTPSRMRSTPRPAHTRGHA